MIVANSCDIFLSLRPLRPPARQPWEPSPTRCLPNASSQRPNICVQIIPDDFKTVPDTSRCLSNDLQMLPDSSRCLQMPQDGSSCFQMIPDDSRCLQMIPDASQMPLSCLPKLISARSSQPSDLIQVTSGFLDESNLQTLLKLANIIQSPLKSYNIL